MAPLQICERARGGDLESKSAEPSYGRADRQSVELRLPSLKGSRAAKTRSGLAFEAEPDSGFDRGKLELGHRSSTASKAFARSSEPTAVAFENSKRFIEVQVDRETDARIIRRRSSGLITIDSPAI